MEAQGRLRFSFIREVGKPVHSISNVCSLLLLPESEKAKPAEPETFNPERYGMMICDECRGLGRPSNGPAKGRVCRTCGGFGLIKKA
jgi:hypothetical protein